MNTFKWFLINEQQAYFGHRIGDVLTAVHDLEDDMSGMGARQIAKVAEDIANQIRKILHGQWTPKHNSDLKELQKLGVAIMKAIDEKDDLNSLIPTVARKLEDISSKTGVRMNDLKAPPQQNNADQINGQDMNMQLTNPQDPSMQPTQQDPNSQLTNMQLQQNLNSQPIMPGIPSLPEGY